MLRSIALTLFALAATFSSAQIFLGADPRIRANERRVRQATLQKVVQALKTVGARHRHYQFGAWPDPDGAVADLDSVLAVLRPCEEKVLLSGIEAYLGEPFPNPRTGDDDVRRGIPVRERYTDFAVDYLLLYAYDFRVDPSSPPPFTIAIVGDGQYPAYVASAYRKSPAYGKKFNLFRSWPGNGLPFSALSEKLRFLAKNGTYVLGNSNPRHRAIEREQALRGTL